MIALAANHLIIQPFSKNLLASAADHILKRFADQLPDLGQVTVLLEQPSAGAALRRYLARSASKVGYPALLGPVITSLPVWARHQAVDTKRQDISTCRELILLESIKLHSKLFGNIDSWRLCSSLFSLIDEMNLQHLDIDSTLSDFTSRIREAYAIDDNTSGHYGFETQVVHTLWHAWHEQLEQMQACDNTLSYIFALQHCLARQPEQAALVVVGCSDWYRCETDWLASALANAQASAVIAADPLFCPAPLQHIDTSFSTAQQTEIDPLTDFINQVFEYDKQPLEQRARHFRERYPESPAADLYSIYAADSAEHEADAICKQASYWLQQGCRNIGLVIEDRKLARRVRALLERVNINILDYAGWTLSTTSAATVIEKWLECIESDFSWMAVLDLLKSPFLHLDDDTLAFAESVYRLEHDIIFHENISFGLQRYKEHVLFRSKRLGWHGKSSEHLVAILDKLNSIRQPLSDIFTDNTERDGADIIACLQQSLLALGVTARYQSDSAGRNILKTLDNMYAGARRYPTTISWSDFRSWLAGTLENTHFIPESGNACIKLMSLAQSRLHNFERLIIASNEQNTIPGKPDFSPFFNNRVRAELGLRTWQDRLHIKRLDFRRLLQCTPVNNRQLDGYQVLFTRKTTENNEAVAPSPWLEAIQTFHQQVYGNNLVNTLINRLQTVAEQNPVAATNPEHEPLVLDQNQIPSRFSASSHQQLIDCPYLYFCARILKLEAREDIRETLSKSDYGQRIHLCLQAFHTQEKGLPPPFDETLTDSNRVQAIKHLQDISLAVFEKDLENNFQHRAWLSQWMKIIPDYIDWQIRRSENFSVFQTEASVSRKLDASVEIHGRLDRIDKHRDGTFAIIDYKTGNIPKPDQVRRGEATQLVSYALLLDQPCRVEYLSLKRNQLQGGLVIEGEELDKLSNQTSKRLLELQSTLADRDELPAWGDESTCRFCSMSGICRRQILDITKFEI